MPQLDLVMTGIKRSEAEKGVSKRELLPISPLILSRLKEVRSPSGHTHDIKMIRAACTLAFFAFLQAGEMTVPNNQTFDESTHLSVLDVAVDDATNPAVMRIKIKQSKTDPFRKSIPICREDQLKSLCGVSNVGLPQY